MADIQLSEYSRLLVILNNTKFQQANPPLYEFLKRLLDNVFRDFKAITDAISPLVPPVPPPIPVVGAGNPGVFFPENENFFDFPIPGQVGPKGDSGLTIPGMDGSDGLDSFPIPGKDGIDGKSSCTIPGFDGNDGSDGFSIQGIPGIQGIQGNPGIDGDTNSGYENIVSQFGPYPLSGLETQLLWGNGVWAQIPISLFNTSNPTGTTSATAVMMGLGSTVVFTPSTTGRVFFWCYVTLTNNTLLDGCTAGMRSGTGTAPANGIAVSGTQRGATKSFTSAINNQGSMVTLVAGIVGATIGTQIWFDLAVNAITGGTASVQSVVFFLQEY